MNDTSIFQSWLQFRSGASEFRYEQSSGHVFRLQDGCFVKVATIKRGLKTPAKILLELI